MVTLEPTTEKQHILTESELNLLLGKLNLSPADVREKMRSVLRRLPIVARTIYDRPNIHATNTPMLTIVETVLYHFDQNNRERVAEALDLTYDGLVLLLVGIILGYEEIRG